MKTVVLQERQSHPADEVGLSSADLKAIRAINPRLLSRDWDDQDRLLIVVGGYIGHLSVSPELEVILRPKVPIANLFGMLEYVTGLKLDEKTRNTFESDNIEEVFAKLADSLAGRVLRRCRQGLYRAYIPVVENLGCIRGRVNTLRMVTHPHLMDLECNFENHTEDIEENRILAWTLRRMCNMPFPETVLARVRRALASLRGSVELRHTPPSVCLDRAYNRLNESYRVLHQLCWFFLANAGPVFAKGSRRMTSFLLNVDSLFESFVAEWLRENLLIAGYGLAKKFPFRVEHMSFEIDMLMRAPDGTPLMVLDTKYKDVESPSHDDVNQVVTYAHSEGCTEAVLIYPSLVSKPLMEARFGSVRVRSLTFDLSNTSLNAAGESLLSQLIGSAPSVHTATDRTG